MIYRSELFFYVNLIKKFEKKAKVFKSAFDNNNKRLKNKKSLKTKADRMLSKLF
jgi:hypothetical protein